MDTDRSCDRPAPLRLSRPEIKHPGYGMSERFGIEPAFQDVCGRLDMQDASVDSPGAGTGADDFPIVITAMPANARQHKIAVRGFA